MAGVGAGTHLPLVCPPTLNQSYIACMPRFINPTTDLGNIFSESHRQKKEYKKCGGTIYLVFVFLGYRRKSRLGGLQKRLYEFLGRKNTRMDQTLGSSQKTIHFVIPR